MAQLQVTLDYPEGSAESEQAIEDMRTALADFDQTYVGGPQAQTMDATQASARDRAVILPLIPLVVLVALTALLRAVVAPVLLVLTVVGTYFASLGASWWIFTHLLGFSAMDEDVPLFAVLGVLPLVVLAQPGVVVCLGVLRDTLVVRTLLVPALALVLGERFWWPRHVQVAPSEHQLAGRT